MVVTDHAKVITHGDPCGVCGGCDWVCAEAKLAELEEATRRAIGDLLAENAELRATLESESYRGIRAMEQENALFAASLGGEPVMALSQQLQSANANRDELAEKLLAAKRERDQLREDLAHAQFEVDAQIARIDLPGGFKEKLALAAAENAALRSKLETMEEKIDTLMPTLREVKSALEDLEAYV